MILIQTFRPRRLMCSRRKWLCSAVVVTALGLAGCGGGGSSAAVDAATSPGTTATDVQTLPAARASIDLLRGMWNLMLDVQIILVAAPTDAAAGTRTVVCTDGGQYELVMLQNLSQPTLPSYQLRFDNCRMLGVLSNGLVEVTATRQVIESSEQPWAGTVRFEGYSIQGADRKREYNGLVTAEGEVNSGGTGLTQPFRATLIGFSFRESRDSLGRGTRFTTTSFKVERLRGTRVSQIYDLAGAWSLSAGNWTAQVDVAAGSRMALLDNDGAERLNAHLQWVGDTIPDFSGALRLVPVGATSLRVELDFNGDGLADRTATYERSSEIGLAL